MKRLERLYTGKNCTKLRPRNWDRVIKVKIVTIGSLIATIIPATGLAKKNQSLRGMYAYRLLLETKPVQAGDLSLPTSMYCPAGNKVPK
jgi:hypothetical protein